MARFIFYGCLVLILAGCSKSEFPKAIRVEGHVTYKQQPVEGATVILVPLNAEGHSATGITEADGSFSLSTYMNPQTRLPGAIAGDYQVSITKREVQKIPEGLDGFQAMAYFSKLPPPKSLIPEIYANSAKSGFTVMVGTTAPAPLQLDLIDKK